MINSCVMSDVSLGTKTRSGESDSDDRRERYARVTWPEAVYQYRPPERETWDGYGITKRHGGGVGCRVEQITGKEYKTVPEYIGRIVIRM